MASYSTTPKGKPILKYEGSKYILGSTRKDGSEIWKCVERECEGRFLNRIVGETRISMPIKDHSQDLPSCVQLIVHLALGKLKQRALADLSVPPAEVLSQAMKDIMDTIDAAMPPSKFMQDLVTKWRINEGESTVDENMTSPRTPSAAKSAKSAKSTRPKKTPTRKRAKLDKKSPEPEETVSTLQERNTSAMDEEEDDDDDDSD